ncbi:hypothetical protein [Melghiribacillus thermohalophilus]|uniref:hypothetical protein n=1 Tax=Melghiribacillus thermohalophilus TaxID=1324956 RepID=UPI001046FFD1|nr:hypothetical protein [Melghiribacillus thermohalophilus]
MLIKAFKKQEEKRAWDMWIQLYPEMLLPHPMGKEPRMKFISFEEFLKKVTKPEVKPERKETVQDIFNRYKKAIKPN